MVLHGFPSGCYAVLLGLSFLITLYDTSCLGHGSDEARVDKAYERPEEFRRPRRQPHFRRQAKRWRGIECRDAASPAYGRRAALSARDLVQVARSCAAFSLRNERHLHSSDCSTSGQLR